MLKRDVVEYHIPLGQRDRNHESCGLNPVGCNGVFAAGQMGHSLNLQKGRTQTGDLGSPAIKEIAQINNFGFAGSCLDVGHTFSECGCSHHVAGAGDGTAERSTEIDSRPPQTRGTPPDVAPLNAKIGPKGSQPLQMKVDGSVTDVAPPGQRYAGSTAACQERPQHTNARPHLPNEIVAGDTRTVVNYLQTQIGSQEIRAG